MCVNMYLNQYFTDKDKENIWGDFSEQFNFICWSATAQAIAFQLIAFLAVFFVLIVQMTQWSHDPTFLN